MAEQLEKLCRNISLTEGEKAGITITEGEIEEVRAQGGRLSDRKNLDREEGEQ
jgi:hypothetical protein